MAYISQAEREINNMLFQIEMEQDVEVAMESQIAAIENQRENYDTDGFILLDEDSSGLQEFPRPYHFRYYIF